MVGAVFFVARYGVLRLIFRLFWYGSWLLLACVIIKTIDRKR